MCSATFSVVRGLWLQQPEGLEVRHCSPGSDAPCLCNLCPSPLVEVQWLEAAASQHCGSQLSASDDSHSQGQNAAVPAPSRPGSYADLSLRKESYCIGTIILWAMARYRLPLWLHLHLEHDLQRDWCYSICCATRKALPYLQWYMGDGKKCGPSQRVLPPVSRTLVHELPTRTTHRRPLQTNDASPSQRLVPLAPLLPPTISSRNQL